MRLSSYRICILVIAFQISSLKSAYMNTSNLAIFLAVCFYVCHKCVCTRLFISSFVCHLKEFFISKLPKRGPSSLCEQNRNVAGQ